MASIETANALFHFQTNRDSVDFALPCYLHCRRLVFASQLIWKWNEALILPLASTKGGMGRPLSFRR